MRHAGGHGSIRRQCGSVGGIVGRGISHRVEHHTDTGIRHNLATAFLGPFLRERHIGSACAHDSDGGRQESAARHGEDAHPTALPHTTDRKFAGPEGGARG